MEPTDPSDFQHQRSSIVVAPTQSLHVAGIDLDALSSELGIYHSSVRGQQLSDGHKIIANYVNACSTATLRIGEDNHRTNEFLQDVLRNPWHPPHNPTPAVFALNEHYQKLIADRWRYLVAKRDAKASPSSQQMDSAWVEESRDLVAKLRAKAVEAVAASIPKLSVLSSSSSGDSSSGKERTSQPTSRLGFVARSGDASRDAETVVPALLTEEGFVVQHWHARHMARMFCSSLASAVRAATEGLPIHAPFCEVIHYHGLCFTATLAVPVIVSDVDETEGGTNQQRVTAGRRQSSTASFAASSSSSFRPSGNALPVEGPVRECAEIIFNTPNLIARNTLQAPETDMAQGMDGRIYTLDIVNSFAEKMFGSSTSLPRPSTEISAAIKKVVPEIARRASSGAFASSAATERTSALRLLMKEYGVPMRYLGMVYEDLTSEEGRAVVLHEMCLRAFRDVWTVAHCMDTASLIADKGAEVASELLTMARRHEVLWSSVVLPHVREKFQITQKTKLPIAMLDRKQLAMDAQRFFNITLDPQNGMAQVHPRVQAGMPMTYEMAPLGMGRKPSVSSTTASPVKPARQLSNIPSATSWVDVTKKIVELLAPEAKFAEARAAVAAAASVANEIPTKISTTTVHYLLHVALDTQSHSGNGVELPLSEQLMKLIRDAHFTTLITDKATAALKKQKAESVVNDLESLTHCLILLAQRVAALVTSTHLTVALSHEHRNQHLGIKQSTRDVALGVSSSLATAFSEYLRTVLNTLPCASDDADDTATHLGTDAISDGYVQNLVTTVLCLNFSNECTMHKKQFQSAMEQQDSLCDAVEALYANTKSSSLHYGLSYYPMLSAHTALFHHFARDAPVAQRPLFPLNGGDERVEWAVPRLEARADAVKSGEAIAECYIAYQDIIRIYISLRKWELAARHILNAEGFISKYRLPRLPILHLRSLMEQRRNTEPIVLIQRAFRDWRSFKKLLSIQLPVARLLQRSGRGCFSRRELHIEFTAATLQRIGRAMKERIDAFKLSQIQLIQRLGRGTLDRRRVFWLYPRRWQCSGRGYLERLELYRYQQRVLIALESLQPVGRGMIARYVMAARLAARKNAKVYIQRSIAGFFGRRKVAEERSRRIIHRIACSFHERKRIGFLHAVVHAATEILQMAGRGYMTRVRIKPEAERVQRELLNHGTTVAQRVGRGYLDRLLLEERRVAIYKSRMLRIIRRNLRGYQARRRMARLAHHRDLVNMVKRIQKAGRGFVLRRILADVALQRPRREKMRAIYEATAYHLGKMRDLMSLRRQHTERVLHYHHVHMNDIKIRAAIDKSDDRVMSPSSRYLQRVGVLPPLQGGVRDRLAKKLEEVEGGQEDSQQQPTQEEALHSTAAAENPTPVAIEEQTPTQSTPTGESALEDTPPNPVDTDSPELPPGNNDVQPPPSSVHVEPLEHVPRARSRTSSIASSQRGTPPAEGAEKRTPTTPRELAPLNNRRYQKKVWKL